jgi:hypothetical protein
MKESLISDQQIDTKNECNVKLAKPRKLFYQHPPLLAPLI